MDSRVLAGVNRLLEAMMRRREEGAGRSFHSNSVLYNFRGRQG